MTDNTGPLQAQGRPASTSRTSLIFESSRRPWQPKLPSGQNRKREAQDLGAPKGAKAMRTGALASGWQRPSEHSVAFLQPHACQRQESRKERKDGELGMGRE